MMHRNFEYGYREDYDNEDLDWYDDEPETMGNRFLPPCPDFGNSRNDLYSEAFGDYRGGYGPGNGFGPPFGPHLNFGTGPPFVLGRGFGPGGPPMKRTHVEEKVVKYLLRCGVAKENLKNLPRELLQLLEPQHCGLCGRSFESFSLSRIHYISKNHMKSQKRWLSLQADKPSFASGSREVPLKSRELYCELCDVHITSKSHAEAHYAGKPHRSIVEGRRNTKNPILLQPGMKDRFNQLVRREKKHLKPLEELQDDTETTKTEIKPFQPELYCDICKTSVTCTEQMTMHLNGKRHLTKEKQHILMMMKKSQASNEDEEGAEEEEEEEKEKNQEGAVENEDETQPKTEGGGDENYDWGNGSGNWDETTTGAE